MPYNLDSNVIDIHAFIILNMFFNQLLAICYDVELNFTDAAAEKKNEGASGSEPVKPEITDSGKATPNKTETSTGKTEKPAQEKTADSKTTKHDSGLNPVKSDSAKDAKDTKEDSAKERPSKKSSSHTRSTKLPSCSLPVNMQPTFYVGGGNGVSL